MKDKPFKQRFMLCTKSPDIGKGMVISLKDKFFKLKRPLVWILMAFVFGCLLGKGMQTEERALWLCFFVLHLPLVFAFSLKRIRRFLWKNIFLCFLSVIAWLGAFLTTKQLQIGTIDDLFQQKTNAEIYGAVKQIVQKELTTAIYLKDIRILIESKDKKVSNLSYCNQILVYVSESEDLMVGNQIKVSGTIQKFQEPTNFGQFNEAFYYRSQGISYKMYGETIQVIHSEYSWIYQMLNQIRQKLVSVYQSLLEPEDAGVICAMTVGEKTLLEEEIRNLYQQNGIAHILAISGLHISVIGLFFFHLLQKLGFHNTISSILTILFVFLYGIMTDFSVSTNRAVVMLTIMLIGKILGRTYDTISAASLSALLILIKEPLQIYQSGFLLSFGAIAGITLVYPVFNTLFFSNKENESIGKKWLIKIEKSFFLSLSITLVTLPVILTFYYEMPIYGTLLNLLVLPLTSLLLMLSLLGGIIGIFSFSIGRFFLGGVDSILFFYQILCIGFTKLPGSVMIFGKPESISILIYFIGFLLLLRFIKKKKIGILLFFILVWILPISSYDGLEITFLDVGQGDGIMIKTPEGKVIVVDGGSTDIKELGKYRLTPFLKAKGISIIDYAVISHTDMDHISGLCELMENQEKGIFIKNLILPDTSLKDESFQNMAELAVNHNISIHYMKKGDNLPIGSVLITCLHPQVNYQAVTRNGYSTVLSLSYRNFDLLLTGDLEEDGENLILEEKMLRKKYDVLKVAHHGSKSSSQFKFLEQILPEVSVISCGSDNSYGHPHKEVLERLKEIKSKVYITAQGGAITIKTNGEKMWITEFNPLNKSPAS